MIIEPDFGTPASKKIETVTVEIDGKSVTVPADASRSNARQ
jgi:formate dehydrogenase major subunit